MRPNRLLSFLAPIRLKYLVLVIIALGLIFFSLTYLGIHQARQSLLKIMVDEGRALVESLTLSSNNAIQAGLLLESLAEEKLIDIARIAEKQLDEKSEPADFRKFSEEYNLLSIDILSENMETIGSDRWADGFAPEYPAEVQMELHDIRQMGGGYRSLLISTRDSLLPLVQYFIYAPAPEGKLLVLSAEAEYLHQIMQEIGIGYLIRQISDQSGIEYIFLQSREGIIFSSQALPPVLKIESDPFLDSLLSADTIGWRRHTMEDREVLEIARRFESVSYPEGVYRIGLNLDDFHEISRQYDRQIIIIAVILFLLTILIVAVVSINQNYFILDRTFRQIRSLTDTIFDRLSSGVLAYDRDGKIVAVNSGLTHLTGIGAESIGRSISEVSEKIGFDVPQQIGPGEKTVSHERRLEAPDGESRTVLAGISSLPQEAGGGAVILMHDITEQKRLEEESHRRRRLSEMGDMAAGVAHEIRNPLNAIGIAAQRLKMEFAPTEDKEEYERLAINILDETGRLNQILTRFLDLAKTRAAEKSPGRLSEAIRRGIESVSGEASRGEVEIVYEPHDEVQVTADLEKLQQVFINLIKNSIQAMPEGGRVTIDVDTSDDKKAIITVTDTGPGFPAESMSKIFQPYFTTRADGSGLGLALAYKTIADCDGTIEAANVPGAGARLRIILPRA